MRELAHIPESLLADLERVPRDRGVSVLLRHAARPPVPVDRSGREIRLTPLGHRTSEALGTLLRGRLHALYASPVPRCDETARSLARGACFAGEVVLEPLLGEPGPFVIDSDRVAPLFSRFGTVWVTRQQLLRKEPLPGFRPTPRAVHRFVAQLLSRPRRRGLLNIHVSHDAVLAVTVGYYTGWVPALWDFPDFLEGAFFWPENEHAFTLRWRGREVVVHPPGG